MLHIYTDGACSGNPGPAAYGYVILASDHATILAESVATWQHSTNQRAELQAIVSALLHCQALEGAGSGLRVYSDSQYAINCLSVWWHKWASQGWQRKHNEPIKNLDIIRAGVEAQKPLAVEWQWVKGHAGNRWNEYVDERVNDAATLAAEVGAVDVGYGGAPAVATEQREYEQARLASLFE